VLKWACVAERSGNLLEIRGARSYCAR